MAIVYPGPAPEGMASLAVHGLLRLCNDHPHAAAEPVFLSPAARALVTGRKLSDFDLLAVTLSFEQQWVALPHLLSTAGIPARHVDRDERHPIVVAGGVACRLNPRPGLPFVDLLAPGDSEPVMGQILTTLFEGRGERRSELLGRLDAVEGILAQPADGRPVRALFCDTGPPVSQVCGISGSTFSGVHLVETGRGCPAGCRFCALAFSRRPPVFFGADAVCSEARAGIERGDRIGLVGAGLGRHPDLSGLVDRLSAVGADLSPASLDPLALASKHGRALLDSLSRSARRSVTLAPEAGSERLRRVINKPFEPDALEQAVRRLGEAGVVNLKLYLMYGLPYEQDEDLHATVEMVALVRRWLLAAHRGRGGTGRLSISLNPFVPKPHTPFECEPMPELSELRRRRDLVSGALRRLGGVSVTGFGPRQAALQCLLDRGDENMAELLADCRGRWPPPAGLLRERAPDMAERVHGSFGADGQTPWRMVDVGVSPDLLGAERVSAAAGRESAPCSPDRCVTCGGCKGLTPGPNR